MPGVSKGQPERLRRRWQDRLGEHVIALEWSPSGSRLAAAQVSGPVRVYDARTGTVMLRLKELEALEAIAGKVERLTVHNGTGGLLNDLVKLRDQ